MESSYFWKTIDLLLSIDYKRSDKDLRANAEIWVNKLIAEKSEDEGNNVTLKKRLLGSARSEISTVRVNNDEVRAFLKQLNLPPFVCQFSHPHVRSKLEKLMGSSLVSLTDRQYMTELQARILDDYAQSMNKRIQIRQAEEMERVKNLVLTGKIPLDEAPPEMANHPVMLIDQFCKKIMAERRAKIKVLKPFIPKYLYWDDTPDPPSGLSIEAGHVLRLNNDRLCVPPDIFLGTDDATNMTDGYMYSDEDYERMKFESPLIKELRDCQTVEELYTLADQIIGVLKTLADSGYKTETE